MEIKSKGNGLKYFEITVPKRIANLDTWCDKDHVMFLAIGRLLEKYVDDEEGGIKGLEEELQYGKDTLADPECLEWDRDYWTGHNPRVEEIIKLYKWWKAWPDWVKRIEDKYLHNAPKDCLKWCDWEEKIFRLEDQFMKRVIDIRGCLWT